MKRSYVRQKYFIFYGIELEAKKLSGIKSKVKHFWAAKNVIFVYFTGIVDTNMIVWVDIWNESSILNIYNKGSIIASSLVYV